jgi:hypothetical protein
VGGGIKTGRNTDVAVGVPTPAFPHFLVPNPVAAHRLWAEWGETSPGQRTREALQSHEVDPPPFGFLLSSFCPPGSSLRQAQSRSWGPLATLPTVAILALENAELAKHFVQTEQWGGKDAYYLSLSHFPKLHFVTRWAQAQDVCENTRKLRYPDFRPQQQERGPGIWEE